MLVTYWIILICFLLLFLFFVLFVLILFWLLLFLLFCIRSCVFVLVVLISSSCCCLFVPIFLFALCFGVLCCFCCVVIFFYMFDCLCVYLLDCLFAWLFVWLIDRLIGCVWLFVWCFCHLLFFMGGQAIINKTLVIGSWFDCLAMFLSLFFCLWFVSFLVCLRIVEPPNSSQVTKHPTFCSPPSPLMRPHPPHVPACARRAFWHIWMIPGSFSGRSCSVVLRINRKCSRLTAAVCCQSTLLSGGGFGLMKLVDWWVEGYFATWKLRDVAG